MNTTATLTRTELTAYETETLHAVATKVRNHSLAVGAFVTRYGQPEILNEAVDLFSEVSESLTYDADIRTGALEYGLFFANNRANDRHASQAAQLQGEFLSLVYKNVIAERATAKVGA